MKNIIAALCILFALPTQAQLLATLNTTTTGGVVGNINSITPQIAFYKKGTTLAKATTIFDQAEVTETDNQIDFILEADEDDAQFSEFIKCLLSDENYVLRIGHKAGNIKSHIGRTISEWIDNATELEQKTITKIVLTYNKIEFVSPGRNLTGDGNWTDFNYEVTLAIYGETSTPPVFFDEFNTKGGNK